MSSYGICSFARGYNISKYKYNTSIYNNCILGYISVTFLRMYYIPFCCCIYRCVPIYCWCLTFVLLNQPAEQSVIMGSTTTFYMVFQDVYVSSPEYLNVLTVRVLDNSSQYLLLIVTSIRDLQYDLFGGRARHDLYYLYLIWPEPRLFETLMSLYQAEPGR